MLGRSAPVVVYESGVLAPSPRVGEGAEVRSH